MKLLRPITEADYERQLARLVAKFERDCATSRQRHAHADNSAHTRLYRAFLESPTPLTAREAAGRAGLSLTTYMRYRVAVERLEQNGWLKRAGLVERTWGVGRGGRAIMHQRVVMTFRGVTERDNKDPRQTLVNTFLARVESLNQRRAMSSCLTQRIETVARPMSERNQQIVAARLEGRLLEDIGEEHNVTRERIRQIVAVSLQPKPQPVSKRVASLEIRTGLQAKMCRDVSRFNGVSVSTIYRVRHGKPIDSNLLTKIEEAMKQMELVLSLQPVELPADGWWLESGIIA